tara:strand:+ start:43630 stop:44523 length:894 start_codon:yes stop_codon:yes gene_type:complete
MEQLYQFAGTWRNFVSILIPKELMSSMMFPAHIRSLCLMIEEDDQCGIILYDTPLKKEDCDREEVIDLLPEDVKGETISRLIVNTMFERILPIFVDRLNQNVEKNICNICLSNYACSLAFTEQPLVPNNTKITDLLNTYNLKIEDVLGRKREFTKELFFQYALIQAFMLGIENELLKSFRDVVITDCFMNDIRSTKSSDFKMICLSALRGTVLPSCQNGDEFHKNSIDWHNHTPPRLSGYSISRCDVVPANVNGNGDGRSGKKRIIIAAKDGVKYLLAYKTEHKADRSMLVERLSVL